MTGNRTVGSNKNEKFLEAFKLPPTHKGVFSKQSVAAADDPGLWRLWTARLAEEGPAGAEASLGFVPIVPLVL